MRLNLRLPLRSADEFPEKPAIATAIAARIREFTAIAIARGDAKVVTRFWLFASCANALLRWLLVGLSAQDILRTGAVRPRKLNKKRILAVVAFLTDPRAQLECRMTALSLRLCQLVTNLAAQKAHGGVDRTPSLVRLATGHVASRVQHELRAVYWDVCLDPTLANDPMRLG